MKFSTIALFAFILTVDIWASIHDTKTFLAGTDPAGKPLSKRGKFLNKANLGVDVLLLVLMVAYLLSFLK
ncbi:hypothetical protein LFYK43_07160 [Ligilactobacillus salitolerans]|uniref:Uncharacterized protein n=1 Tax=Ligilactobacillus salitolerans TaxID=1808352 RepID=A0A401IRW5_9LACO|nr:hypothetical protein [Ligilactobacillus salitolerans]GBG94257.1 hypothetical protein LFYK43_07160 [Ligilactobacillus salitolerans]